MTTIRDRIKELRRVPAAELRANPKNWRKHPQHQQDGVKAMLNRIGYADAVIARDTEDGLVLLDGHLRVGTTPEAVIPVLVVELSDQEADEILATLDPLASLAEPDIGLLNALLVSIQGDDGVSVLLQDISDLYGTGLVELLEQATKADYMPPDEKFLTGEGSQPATMKSLTLHFDIGIYDAVVAVGYRLGETWELDTLSDVVYEALRRAADGIG